MQVQCEVQAVLLADCPRSIITYDSYYLTLSESLLRRILSTYIS